MLSVTTPLISQVELQLNQALTAYLHPPQRAGWPERPLYSDALTSTILGEFLFWCDLFGFNRLLVLSQVAHETNWFRFTGDVAAWQFNFAGLGATGGIPGHSFPTPSSGALAVVAHHAVYRWGPRERWPLHLQQYAGEHVDPRYDEVLRSGNAGEMIVLGDYRGTWAVPGITYPEAIIGVGTRIESAGGVPMAEQPTERMIRLLREVGLEVHDIRGALPVNSNPQHRYSTMALSQVRYVVFHWTGDRFTRETLKTITGTDYGVGVIVPHMTPEDEMDLLRWYANYHIGRDGGTWGGIAYGTLILPSGRVYVAWSIGTRTYHAFNANSLSYAVCSPNSNAALPNPRQLQACRAVWHVLAHMTPEIEVERSRVIGHLEAVILDPRNTTACPGTFLPDLKAWRAEEPGPTPPPRDSNAREFSGGLWMINTEDSPLLTYWEEHGGVEELGLPLGGMRLDPDGVYRQLLENVELESYPDGFGPYAGPWVRKGGSDSATARWGSRWPRSRIERYREEHKSPQRYRRQTW